MRSLTAPAPPSRIGPLEFVVLMAMVQALQALAVDSMLPALGALSTDLGARDPNERQLVVGIFLICTGLGCLIPGTLADRLGRRPVLLGCLGLYVVFSTLCALSVNFTMMLVMRAALGLSCAGLMVLPATIIRDRYEGDRMARMQSMVAMTFMVVPMMAPSFGQLVWHLAGWRWIFGAMGVMACLVIGWAGLRLPESLPREHRRATNPRQIAQTLVQVVICREAVGYTLGQALVQGAMFGYINSAEQLVAERLGAGPRFPLIFAGMALSMAFTNFVNSRIVERFGARRVSQAALFIYIAASLVQLSLAWHGRETLVQFVPVMAVNLCLMGFIGANFVAIALQPFGRAAGAAASAQSFIRMVLAAGLGALVGQAFDGTARPLALTMTLSGVGCLLLVLFSERGQLFRRLHPAGTPRPVA